MSSSPRLEIRYVPLADAVRWDRNAKKHDLGGLIASVRRYGFRDAPIFDATLGVIVAGNGRVEALQLMQEAGEEMPRGLAMSPAGEWLVPLQMGVYADSKAEAEAFGIDHNNLTVAGGDLGPEATYRLWEQDGLVQLLRELEAADQLPLTLDSDDLATLQAPLLPSAEPSPSAGRTVLCPHCGGKFKPTKAHQC